MITGYAGPSPSYKNGLINYISNTKQVPESERSKYGSLSDVTTTYDKYGNAGNIGLTVNGVDRNGTGGGNGYIRVFFMF